MMEKHNIRKSSAAAPATLGKVTCSSACSSSPYLPRRVDGKLTYFVVNRCGTAPNFLLSTSASSGCRVACV